MQHTAQQIELKHYIENHGYAARIEGQGVVVIMPCMRGNSTVIEYNYVETYRQARLALEY